MFSTSFNYSNTFTQFELFQIYIIKKCVFVRGKSDSLIDSAENFLRLCET